MKLTLGAIAHSAWNAGAGPLRIPHGMRALGAAKFLIDPFLSDNPSWDNGWSSYLTGKNSIQGGER